MDVPRETADRLIQFETLVRLWTPRINLVAPGTLSEFRQRHIEDSLQIAECGPETASRWVDLGSGGGLPGLVVAISRPTCRVTLVESDQRKAAFLRSAARELSLNVDVRAERIESLRLDPPDIVSARALAALPKLLSLARPLGGPDTIYLFSKGERFEEELSAARRVWTFTEDVIPSRTREGSVILRLGNVERA